MSNSTPLTAPFAGVIGFAALAVSLVGMIVIMLSLNLITGLAMLFGGALVFVIVTRCEVWYVDRMRSALSSEPSRHLNKGEPKS